MGHSNRSTTRRAYGAVLLLAALGADFLRPALSLAAPAGADETLRAFPLCENGPCSADQIAKRFEFVASMSERFSHDPEGHLKVTVQFSAPLDTSSVVPGKTIFLRTLQGSVEFELLFGTSGDGFLLVSKANRGELFPNLGRAIDVTLVMLGTDHDGSGVIRSAEGSALDGDRDGQPGGDFEIRVTCRNIDPYWCE